MTTLPYESVQLAATQLLDAAEPWAGGLGVAKSLVAEATADDELTGQPFIAPEPAVLDDSARLTESMQTHLDWMAASGMPAEVDAATAAARLQAVAAVMPPDLLLGLETVIRRGTDPFAALSSVPASVLFDDAERAAIDALPRSLTPAPPIGTLSTGGYEGYAMAILKITRLCNLRCRYCHDWREGPGNTMSVDVLARTLHGFLSDPKTSHLDVALHGGEPTMVGRRGLLRLLWLQNHFLRPDQTVRTNFQTNGYRINEGILRLAARYGLRFGVSLDLWPDRHNANRPDVRGHDTYDQTLETIRRAQRYGVLSGIIVVVDEALIERGARPLYEELVRLGVESVALLAERPDNDPASGDRLLPRALWGRFMLDLDEIRRDRPTPLIRIRELDSLIEAVRGNDATYCEHRGNCIGAFFVVDVDGSIGHCDRYVGVPAFTKFGHAGTGPTALRRNLAVKLLSSAEAKARQGRESCRWNSICHGWCPHERFLAESYGQQRADGCCGLDELIAGLASREAPTTFPSLAELTVS